MFSYDRICSLTIECVFLPCSLTTGAHKIDARRMETSIMSVPYMDRGFELVVKEKIVAADLMAWAQVSVSVSVHYRMCSLTIECVF